MLTPNSRQQVQQLNQFISELTNRDTLGEKELKRQRTAATMQQGTTVNESSSA